MVLCVGMKMDCFVKWSTTTKIAVKPSEEVVRATADDLVEI